MERSDDDVYLFALRLDDNLLSNTFPAFPLQDGFLIPLGELCRLLDFAILAEPAKGVASGFFIEEKRRFALNVQAGTVTVDGKTRPVDRSQIELHADDIYVAASQISQWLPLDLNVSKRTSTLTVVPREPLPMQLSSKRQRMEARLGQGGAAAQSYPRLADPYRAWELPMVDETLSSTVQTGGQGVHPFDALSTTFASADLAWLSSSLYVNADAHAGLTDFWMTMGRRDPEGGLLGPLRATEFSFGEVLDPGLDLVSSANTGPGLAVSNHPLQQANAFDRHSFQGDLPPGWQVELYRNQALLAFQASRADGRYEFLNVPLYFGWNEFRMVFYGPQGQRREEIVRFDVSESQTPEGTFQYRVIGDNPHTVGRHERFEGDYGLSKQLAASMAVAEVAQNGVDHRYTQAGLQGFWRHLSAGVTGVEDSLGGSAVETALRTRLGSLSLTGKRVDLQGGYTSEMFQSVIGKVKNRTSVDASMLLPSMEHCWLTCDLSATQDQLVASGREDTLSSRLTTSYHGYFLSNQLSRTVGQGAAAIYTQPATGEFLLSKFFPSVSLRAQSDYQASDGRRFTAFSVQADTPVFDPYQLRAEISHAILNHDTSFQVGGDKTHGTYSLGFDLGYSTQTRFSADITVRLGLGRDPRTGRVYTQAQSMANFGAVSTSAFLDANNNGLKDPGEKPIEGVAFKANGTPQEGRTDVQGVTFIKNLPTELPANITVTSSSLEDPLMVPKLAGVKVIPRPGHVTRLDVPIIVLGEVMGTTYLRRGAKPQELAGLVLELADARGEAVKTMRSAYDGFFDFTGVPPGDYTLRVGAGEARHLGILLPAPRPFTITPQGTLLDGLDLVVEPVPAPETVAAMPSLKEKVLP